VLHWLSRFIALRQFFDGPADGFERGASADVSRVGEIDLFFLLLDCHLFSTHFASLGVNN
jgi:hypothetical protein